MKVLARTCFILMKIVIRNMASAKELKNKTGGDKWGNVVH